MAGGDCRLPIFTLILGLIRRSCIFSNHLIFMTFGYWLYIWCLGYKWYLRPFLVIILEVLWGCSRLNGMSLMFVGLTNVILFLIYMSISSTKSFSCYNVLHLFFCNFFNSFKCVEVLYLSTTSIILSLSTSWPRDPLSASSCVQWRATFFLVLGALILDWASKFLKKTTWGNV